MPEKTQGQYLQIIIFWLCTIFLVSIVFSLRAISSISIAILLVVGSVDMKKRKVLFFTNHPLLYFSIACTALYLLKVLSLSYTENTEGGIKHLEKTSALVIVPLAVYVCKNSITRVRFEKLMTYLAIAVVFAGLFCFSIAAINYSNEPNPSFFFYHALVEPLSQHAIQMSILVFIALVFLMESLRGTATAIRRSFEITLIVILTLFMFFLSSKLIIAFFLIYLFYYLVRGMVKDGQPGKYRLLLIAVPVISIVLILATSNRVSNRFREITYGNIDLYKQEKFNPGVYFNGLQFRLLQWRFVYEILNEERAWLSGLSPGDAQSFLNKKYVLTNMYTGAPGTDEKGFIGYHTHNQFLQVLLQNGIPGLLIFLIITMLLIRFFINRRDWLLRFTIALLLIYCFTDAILETQYGLILFTFFPGFIYWGTRKTKGIKTYPERNDS